MNESDKLGERSGGESQETNNGSAVREATKSDSESPGYRSLLQSETRYRELVENANDIIYLTDFKGTFTFANGAVSRITGYRNEEIIGQHFRNFIHPDHRNEVEEFYRKQFAERVSDTYHEVPIVTKQGQTVWLGLKVQLALEQGRVVGFRSIARDLTEQVKTEEVLREKEQMLANILAASPVGICRVQDRKISWVNEAMMKMFGCSSAKELIGKSTSELYASGEEYERVGALLYENYKSGTESETYAKLVRKDGSVFDGQVRISAPDPTNPMKGAIAVFSDISSVREAQRALQESEYRYRRLVEQLPDVIFSLDSAGYFTFVNSQVEKFLGYPIGQVLETSLWDYVAPEYRSLARSLLAVRPDAIWDEELAVDDSHRARKWVRIRCQASFDEMGKLTGFEGVMVDTTVRKMLEEELKTSREELYAHMVQAGKSKAIARHTAEVAHELRQPLAIIGGFARRMSRLLESGDAIDRDSHNKCSQMIVREVQRLERILTGLIDFSRHEGLQLERVDPNNLIQEVLQIHEERFKEKGLRLDVNFGSDIGQVLLDPYRFQQVIRNLISNAIEASFQNGVIRIDTGVFMTGRTSQLTGELKAKEYFELKIRNGGRIVPPGELERFFDPFYTTKEYGTGIGLTLCKRIVEDHNGSISVKSDADGTAFTVWIPFKPIEMTRLQSMVVEGGSTSHSEKNDAH